MKYFMSLVAVTFLMVGCAGHQIEESVGNLDSWFEIQEKIAEKLQNQKGIGGKRNHVFPILGAQYSIGTILSNDNDFVTRCVIKEGIVEEFGMRLPSINAKTNFDANVGLPESWLSQYKIGQAKANYKTGGETKYKLIDIVVNTISSFNINEIIKKNKCFETLRGHEYAGSEVKIIRGIISGKLVASSRIILDRGANFTVSETEILKIKRDTNGGFAFEEKISSPQYFISTKVLIPGSDDVRPPKNSDHVFMIDSQGCQHVGGFAYGEDDETLDVNLMAKESEDGTNMNKCN